MRSPGWRECWLLLPQPSEALDTTRLLAQRADRRSASKHADYRSRARAGVDLEAGNAVEFEQFRLRSSQRRHAGSAARRRCRPCGRWSPHRCPPNRTCESLRIRLSMSNSSGRPLVQLPSSVKYPLPSSGSSAPVFTGDLLPSNRAAGSLDPFALQAAFPPSLVARDCHDYYGSSATPRRQQRTVRLPQARRLGGHRRDASHVHSYAGRQGRRPAVPRGHRRALPQHRTRPRPPEQQTVGRDGPRTETGA